MKQLFLVLFFMLSVVGPGAAQPAIGGPGPPPNPWITTGPQIYYNGGCITIPSTVTGGCKGAGSINAATIYLNGYQLTPSAILSGNAGNLAYYNASGTTLSPLVLGLGAEQLLGGTASGTGGLLGSVSPTVTGTAQFANLMVGSALYGGSAGNSTLNAYSSSAPLAGGSALGSDAATLGGSNVNVTNYSDPTLVASSCTGSTITFPSVPGWVQPVGILILDLTTPSNIPPITYYESKSGNTITVSNAVTCVANDVIAFGVQPQLNIIDLGAASSQGAWDLNWKTADTAGTQHTVFLQAFGTDNNEGGATFNNAAGAWVGDNDNIVYGYGPPQTTNAATPATAVTAGSFVDGISYKIVSIGTTDFTAIGASANTVGVIFTATGVGSGTGTAGNVTLSFAAVPSWVIALQTASDITASVLPAGTTVVSKTPTKVVVSNIPTGGGVGGADVIQFSGQVARWSTVGPVDANSGGIVPDDDDTEVLGWASGHRWHDIETTHIGLGAGQAISFETSNTHTLGWTGGILSYVVDGSCDIQIFDNGQLRLCGAPTLPTGFAGSIAYDTTTNAFSGYNGSWQQFNAANALTGSTLAANVTNASITTFSPAIASTQLAYTSPGTGGSSRTLSNKFADILNVIDYGADPTHTSNSSTAIQNAINEACNRSASAGFAGPGVVVYFAGFFLAHDISIQCSGVTLMASFSDITGSGGVIDYTGASGFGVLAQPVSWPAVTTTGRLGGFTIDGLGFYDSSTTSTTTAIVVNGVFGARLRNLSALGNPYNFISLYGDYHTIISDMTLLYLPGGYSGGYTWLGIRNNDISINGDLAGQNSSGGSCSLGDCSTRTDVVIIDNVTGEGNSGVGILISNMSYTVGGKHDTFENKAYTLYSSCSTGFPNGSYCPNETNFLDLEGEGWLDDGIFLSDSNSFKCTSCYSSGNGSGSNNAIHAVAANYSIVGDDVVVWDHGRLGNTGGSCAYIAQPDSKILNSDIFTCDLSNIGGAGVEIASNNSHLITGNTFCTVNGNSSSYMSAIRIDGTADYVTERDNNYSMCPVTAVNNLSSGTHNFSEGLRTDGTWAISPPSVGSYSINGSPGSTTISVETILNYNNTASVGIGDGTHATNFVVSKGAIYMGSTSGVACSGLPTVSFATVGGVVTHC